MAWIRKVSVDEASGLLRSIYDAAIRRAGRVFQIVQIQSLHPRALRASIQLYVEVMLGPGPLSRARREMIATTVSRVNACHY